MKKIIQQKDNLSNSISEKIKAAKSFIIFEYAGLDAKTITTLRSTLFKADAKLLVLKNNILNRALAKANIKDFGELVGPNAIVWGNDDVIVPLREVFNLKKENDFIKIKGSYLENTYLDPHRTESFASLPNREGLYSMLLSCLQQPIRNFLYGLKSLSETKN
ncbi:MAG: 50S ribosomal protein L10 [Malacoplasma sp.]|nr:50S ribosomal protein L10 [Malacoplasma sp.]